MYDNEQSVFDVILTIYIVKLYTVTNICAYL